MRIITGLEVVKENLLKNDMGIGYVQNAIDYITYLESNKDIIYVVEVRIDFNDGYSLPSQVQSYYKDYKTALEKAVIKCNDIVSVTISNKMTSIHDFIRSGYNKDKDLITVTVKERRLN